MSLKYFRYCFTRAAIARYLRLGGLFSHSLVVSQDQGAVRVRISTGYNSAHNRHFQPS